MRKNLLNDLVSETPELTAVNSEAPPAPARAAPLGSKGAVGAMSRALAQIASDRDAGVRAAADVVEIDAALLIESTFRDRLEGAGADRAELVASIREAGQQVPILVRPHPSEAGKFQIAYGHRRAAALREIGRPVRALVRAMSDSELIVAQGAENNARRDLSFIERAYFAGDLESRGVDRTTIMTALSVDKTELSRLIAVTRAVPSDIIKQIGPAPKAGRRRWIDLAERIEPGDAVKEARRITASERFRGLPDSDARFLAVFEAVGPRRVAGRKPEIWKDGAGRKLVRVERAEGRFTLSIDETLEPSFGDYLLERLPEILASFQRRDGA